MTFEQKFKNVINTFVTDFVFHLAGIMNQIYEVEPPIVHGIGRRCNQANINQSDPKNSKYLLLNILLVFQRVGDAITLTWSPPYSRQSEFSVLPGTECFLSYYHRDCVAFNRKAWLGHRNKAKRMSIWPCKLTRDTKTSHHHNANAHWSSYKMHACGRDNSPGALLFHTTNDSRGCNLCENSFVILCQFC